MSNLITLEALDRDGAIRETAEAAGATRADFLKRSGMAGAGFVAGGVLFSGFVSPAEAAISTRNRSKKNDVKIAQLRADARVPRGRVLQAGQRLGRAARTRASRRSPSVTGAHEAAHVKALKAALGSKAVKKPTFDFGDTVTDQYKFRQTAQVLEDTGVAAYAGQGPNILQRPVVEGRALDPLGRGAPRGVDPLHQLERRRWYRPGSAPIRRRWRSTRR